MAKLIVDDWFKFATGRTVIVGRGDQTKYGPFPLRAEVWIDAAKVGVIGISSQRMPGPRTAQSTTLVSLETDEVIDWTTESIKNENVLLIW